MFMSADTEQEQEETVQVGYEWFRFHSLQKTLECKSVSLFLTHRFTFLIIHHETISKDKEQIFKIVVHFHLCFLNVNEF